MCGWESRQFHFTGRTPSVCGMEQEEGEECMPSPLQFYTEVPENRHMYVDECSLNRSPLCLFKRSKPSASNKSVMLLRYIISLSEYSTLQVDSGF